MDTILAAWNEVRLGVRSESAFAALMADPDLIDDLDRYGETDWDAYQDILALAGRYADEQMDAAVFQELVEARLRGEPA